jgi:hypothetical protein
MKRRYLLIAGCLLGAVSVGLNIHLYFLKKDAPSARPAPESTVTPEGAVSEDTVPVREIKASPGFSAGTFDFSDTAFADDSWKLTEPRSAISLDKPFDWEDANPARTKVDPDNPFDASDTATTPPVIKDGAVVGPVQPSPPPPPK